MIPLALLWGRRLWPYVTLTAVLALVMLAAAGFRGRQDTVALRVAHQATAVATQVARAADTVFVHDTVVAARRVTVYRTARDTALVHLTDTVLVKTALAECDSAIGSLTGTVADGGRAIRAHVAVEGALRTELAISERLRAPRYRVTSYGGADLAGVPVTGLETAVRLTEHWSVVGRLDKRWSAGEPTRRYVLASYSF